MKKIETVDDFREFLNANHNRILENAVNTHGPWTVGSDPIKIM